MPAQILQAQSSIMRIRIAGAQVLESSSRTDMVLPKAARRCWLSWRNCIRRLEQDGIRRNGRPLPVAMQRSAASPPQGSWPSTRV